jgi:hypothetical protein
VKILLDENVPIQTLDLLARVLRGHEIDHVDRIGWKGKKDSFLLPDAASAGYEVSSPRTRTSSTIPTSVDSSDGPSSTTFASGRVRAFAGSAQR